MDTGGGGTGVGGGTEKIGICLGDLGFGGLHYGVNSAFVGNLEFLVPGVAVSLLTCSAEALLPVFLVSCF